MSLLLKYLNDLKVNHQNSLTLYDRKVGRDTKGGLKGTEFFLSVFLTKRKKKLYIKAYLFEI